MKPAKPLANRERLTPYLLGGLAVLLMVGFVLFVQRGAHVELQGSILKVRTLGLDETNSLAVIDFRFTNPSDYTFQVSDVAVSLIDSSGNSLEGAVVAETDARRVFEYYPGLGQKFNETLVIKDKVGPKQQLDRMVSVRFDAPEKTLDGRKNLIIKVKDPDGPESEIREKK